VSVLGGSQTDLNSPYGLALDGAGDLFVADRTANAITVYDPGARGDTAPIRTITGPHAQLSSPQALALDRSGHLWVVNGQSSSLTEYPVSASGDTAPIAVISGPASGLNEPQGITQDAAGNLLVTNTFGHSLATFPDPEPAGSVSPSSTISGAATKLDFPIGIDVDAADRRYVANEFGGLNVYAAGASGNAAPQAVITGAATGLAAPQAVAVTAPLYVLTRPLPRAFADRRYRAQLYSLLGRRPLHWKLVRGHLPAGLKLTRAGAILGTPRRAGTVTITVQVTDSTRPAMRARRTTRLTVRSLSLQ
jgi:hypothetical protein